MKKPEKHFRTYKRLTKRFLMSLEEGEFLVGNVCDHHCRPAFAENVAPRPEREKQWERIKKLGADGRVCELFPDRSGFEGLARRKQESAKKHGYEH